VKGEDSRNPKPNEAREKPAEPSEMGHGEKRDPAVAQSPKQGGSEAQKEIPQQVAAGSERVGGEEQTVVVNDGAGTIRIRRAPQGVGPGNQGGEQQQGSRGRDSREVGAREGQAANLKLSFSQFESTFGSEELKRQRDAYLEQRRTQAKGGRNEEQWKKFRAAVENYVDQVKPGNQTALNAAASPFAAWLAAVHRNIHREFALKFLRSLPLLGGPFADPNLRTRLAIVVNQDGSLYQVGVIQTSGFTPYDYGAWNAVTKAAPFPEAPKKILSGDGRVYVHWDFYNNERQCGTFNAEPYILPMPDRKEPPAPGPFHDNGSGDSTSKGKLGFAPAAGPKRAALP
jgi:TonB family protein